MKTIALIGGTGRVGAHVASTAVQQGYRVRMLTRNRKAEASEGIRLVTGDATDPDAVRSLLDGCDAVINAYGQSAKGEQRYSEITKRILSVMKQLDIERYIGVTGGSLTLPGDRKSLTNRMGALIFRMLYPDMIKDKQKEFAVLTSCEAKWTLVRLPFVFEGEGAGRIKESVTDMPGFRMSNRDIARFLVRQIDDETYMRRTPFISN